MEKLIKTPLFMTFYYEKILYTLHMSEINDVVFAFDIDQTLVCSEHRRRYLPDGRLDIKYWNTHHTEEEVMKDALLPLVELAKKVYQKGHRVVAFTSRNMSSFDFEYLKKHGILFHKIYYRAWGDLRSTIMLKKEQIKQELEKNGGKKIVFYEDHKGVLEMANKFKQVKAIDAIALNSSYALCKINNK